MRAVLGVAASLALGCPAAPPAPAAKVTRVELRRVGGQSLELVPRPGQLPYCLAFSLAEGGPVRQLTRTPDNKSLACPGGEAVMHTPIKIPVREGKVKILVFLSSQPLKASSVAEQLLESRSKPDWSTLDLRLPGTVFTETLEFTPGADPGR